MKAFYVVCLILALSLSVHGTPMDSATVEDSPKADSSQLQLGRAVAVASFTGVSYLGSFYLIFKDAWWDSSNSNFHFANDFEYAKNMDKGGHFLAGVLLAEGFVDGFRWSGVSEVNSYLLAGTMASLTHVGIDIKDGFDERWGYSIFDVLSGALGGFYPMARRYIPAFQYIDYKAGYWLNSKAYWRQEGDHTFIVTDDYCNQSHWLSFKVDKMLPQSAAAYWPDILALSAGISVEDKIFTDRMDDAKYIVYVGLDWDLENAIKPSSHLTQRLVHYLNYLKLPAPTLQVYPTRKIKWTYPIEIKF